MSNPSTDQSLIKLAPSNCPEHNQPYECYCSLQKCENRIRVCGMCRDEHSGHVNFLTEKKQVNDDLNKGLRRCFEKVNEYDTRAEELLKLMKSARERAHNQYQSMQNSLIERMKRDKQTLQRFIHNMRQLATRIQEKQRVKNYFSKLRKHNLFQLRIRLSTVQGMRKFKQKSEKLRELTSKSNNDEIHKLYQQFYSQKRNFNHFLQNNVTFKMTQIIALKNSKRRVYERQQIKRQQNNNKGEIELKQRQQKDQEKQNNNGVKICVKQKPKAKTTLNIGEGIINGILNFLNF